MAKHSPIGALHLLLGCLKKLSGGEWLTKSKIFGDANFFADRKDLIRESEKLIHDPKLKVDGYDGYIVTPPLTSREANARMIPDLLVMIMESSPYTKEVYIKLTEKDEGEKYSIAYRQQPYPRLENSWPFYHYPSESWRVIFRDEPKKSFRPTQSIDVVAFIRGVAFQTWLGHSFDVMDPRDWGGGHEVLAVVPPFEAKPTIEHHHYEWFVDTSQQALKGQSNFVKSSVKSLLEDPYDSKLFRSGNYDVNKGLGTGQRTFGQILAAYALAHPSDDHLGVEEWVGFYDRAFGDDRDYLFGTIGKSPIKPSDTPSVWPEVKTKRVVKFRD